MSQGPKYLNLFFLKIGRLGGGGSDFASFVQHVGVPSVDISFGEGILCPFLLILLYAYLLACKFQYLFSETANFL